MSNSFTLAWPWVLIVLPLPLLLRWLLPAAAAPAVTLRLPFFALIQAGCSTGRHSFSRWRFLLALLAWLLLLIAASRPQFVGEPVRLATTGRELLLAVDISGSMAIEDMLVHNALVSRLQAVKAVAGEFIQRRVGDRIGLILFGAQAYLQSPLTFDRTTVQTLLDEAEIGFAGKETAIGDAIGLAVKRLYDRPPGNRVLLLLTDGANTAGTVEPLRAADLAAQAGVRIYTIGVGADELRVNNWPGPQRLDTGTDLDEDTLNAIAARTGGRYFRARNSDSLQDIYRLLDELEPLAGKEKLFLPVRELYPWPLAAAFLLSILMAVADYLPGRGGVRV